MCPTMGNSVAYDRVLCFLFKKTCDDKDKLSVPLHMQLVTVHQSIQIYGMRDAVKLGFLSW